MDANHYLKVEQHGDMAAVRLRNPRLDEGEVCQLFEELLALVTRDGCRKLALSLGPQPPVCLYSIFIAKLTTLHRVLAEHGGQLVLTDVAAVLHSVFAACKLESKFIFLADLDTALRYFRS